MNLCSEALSLDKVKLGFLFLNSTIQLTLVIFFVVVFLYYRFWSSNLSWPENLSTNPEFGSRLKKKRWEESKKYLKRSSGDLKRSWETSVETSGAVMEKKRILFFQKVFLVTSWCPEMEGTLQPHHQWWWSPETFYLWVLQRTTAFEVLLCFSILRNVSLCESVSLGPSALCWWRKWINPLSPALISHSLGPGWGDHHGLSSVASAPPHLLWRSEDRCHGWAKTLWSWTRL